MNTPLGPVCFAVGLGMFALALANGLRGPTLALYPLGVFLFVFGLGLTARSRRIRP